MTAVVLLAVLVATLATFANKVAVGQLFEPILGQMMECDEPFTSKIAYKDVSLTREDSSTWVMSGVLEVKEDLPGPLEVKFQIDRCESSTSDNCKTLTTLDSEGCKELKMNKGIVFTMFNATGTVPQCPIKANSFVIEKHVMDVSEKEANEAYALSREWRYVVKVFQNGEMIVCNYGHLTFSSKKKEGYSFD